MGRHATGPADAYFLVKAECHYWVIYVFLDGDEYLASDAVFGVKDELVAEILGRLSQSAPAAVRDMTQVALGVGK